MYTYLAAFYLLSITFIQPLEAAHGELPPNGSVVNTTDTSPNLINDPPLLQGWTPSPNGRGSIDILWACGFTLFLCSWSVLCLNVPATCDGWWRIIRRKCYWTFLGILGPEFVVQSALGQWTSACHSVWQFKLLGHPEWTMTHAFFADMGGFILHTKDWIPFPLDARQVHYLVAEGYIPYSSVAISKQEIVDKNKNDAIVRIITIGQTLWFVLNVITRGSQHLAITTLELTTIASVICTLSTYFCWAHKPSDIQTGIVLATDVTIAEILNKAGDRAREPYSLTPLDFVGRRDWSWTIYWSYWINILKKIHMTGPPKPRPLDRMPNDNFPAMSPTSMFCLFLLQTAYAGVQIVAWNFDFPTNTERLMWRISTLIIIGAVMICWIADRYAFRVLPALRRRLAAIQNPQELKTLAYHSSWNGAARPAKNDRSFGDRFRKFGNKYDVVSEVPLKAVMPLTFFGFLYCWARGYIFAEDLAALRALPSSAYDTVNWNHFLPHF